MNSHHHHPIRVHGRAPLVVVALLLATLGLVSWPAGAATAPVAPVPVGVWPLQPKPTVVRAFDPPGTVFGPGHRGVDLGGTTGAVVHTALAGRVTFAGRLAGRGVVVVDHGTTRTTYEPVAATVKVGDVLTRGQRIGALQVAGSHCFPRACLHWGWKRGSTYLDPLQLVGGRSIMLLPLWTAPATTYVPVPSLPYAGYPDEQLGIPGIRRPGMPALPWVSPPVGDAGAAVEAPQAPVWHRPLAMGHALV